MNNKYLIFPFFLLFSVIVYGQQPPKVTITQPAEGTVFDGVQVKVDYTVSGTAVNFVKILLNDKPLLLISHVKIGQNSAMVDVLPQDCKISIVAINDFGESNYAVVNLKRSTYIFKPTLYILSIGVNVMMR